MLSLIIKLSLVSLFIAALIVSAESKISKYSNKISGTFLCYGTFYCLIQKVVRDKILAVKKL